MQWKKEITTRYSETGQDKIIHHSSYIVYLEVARIDFLKNVGFDINEMEKNNIFCPVVDLSIKYIKPLFSLDNIEVLAEMRRYSKLRFEFNYKIIRKGTLISTAKTLHCFIDENFKIIPLPQDLLQHMSQ
jgi:acyl-CoA thioester hydrolase